MAKGKKKKAADMPMEGMPVKMPKMKMAPGKPKATAAKMPKKGK